MPHNKIRSPKKNKTPLKKNVTGLKKYITPTNIYRGALISGALGLIGTVAYKNRVLDEQSQKKKIQDDYSKQINEIELAIDKCYSELVEMEKKEESKLDKFFEILNVQIGIRKKTSDELDKILKSYYELKKNRDKEIKYQLKEDDKSFSLGELKKCNKLKENIQERYAIKVNDLMKKINDAEKNAASYGYAIQKYKNKLGLS
jgi:hypothetical protein